MKRMILIGLALIAVVALVFVGCGKKEPEAPKQDQMPMFDHGPSGEQGVGIKWTKPDRWNEEHARPMRITTYSAPAASGDKEPAECAVFYFGSSQGGDVSSNIDRWIGQFENPVPTRSSKTINGMQVHFVQIVGSYLAPSGPMQESAGTKDNFRLLGAIVEGPMGSVFFKFTGPAKSIAAAEKEFESLVNSIAKE